MLPEFVENLKGPEWLEWCKASKGSDARTVQSQVCQHKMQVHREDLCRLKGLQLYGATSFSSLLVLNNKSLPPVCATFGRNPNIHTCTYIYAHTHACADTNRTHVCSHAHMYIHTRIGIKLSPDDVTFALKMRLTSGARLFGQPA